MSPKTVDGVAGRALDEPGLFSLPKQGVFNFASVIVSIIDLTKVF